VIPGRPVLGGGRRAVLQRLDCCRTNSGPLSSPRSAPNPDCATSPLALPPALCCNSGVLQPQPGEYRGALPSVRGSWGVSPHTCLTFLGGRVGKMTPSPATGRARPPTVNQRETHLTDSGKKTFRQTSGQSSARQARSRGPAGAREVGAPIGLGERHLPHNVAVVDRHHDTPTAHIDADVADAR